MAALIDMGVVRLASIDMGVVRLRLGNRQPLALDPEVPVQKGL